MVKHYLHNLSAPFSFRRVSLAALLLLIGSTASAYDFAVKNADGVRIYYNKLYGGGVEVTSGPSEYSGIVNITSSVTYGGTSYSVTSIGEYAFDDCSGLTKVTIPESVTAIGKYAFSKCTGLTNVAIPASVTSIGAGAFSDCTGLTEVTIPESVTSIEFNAFRDCSGLTEVNFNATNCTSMGMDYNGNYWGAFYRCYNIQKLTIGNNVQSIPDYAFCRCSGLTEVTIPESVTSIGIYAFDGCTGLTEVTIPESVTSIGGSAFSYCTGLTEVTIPESVSSIGSYAFDGCTGLTEVTIPESVTSIGGYAFEGCTGLKSIVVDSNNPVYDSRENCNSIIESASNTLISGCMNSKIPNSVTSIRTGAFSVCSGLTEVTIPESVTSIGGSAFYSCDGLTEVNFNATNCTEIGRYNYDESIFYSAFSGCNNLRKLTIGNNVKSIPDYAFKNCI